MAHLIFSALWDDFRRDGKPQWWLKNERASNAFSQEAGVSPLPCLAFSLQRFLLEFLSSANRAIAKQCRGKVMAPYFQKFTPRAG
ncbi:MAG: hypothetical protein K2W93_21710 [Burkholderiaceae bacterium]|nr:hypothetical protein [Burkholderiaceae bacterium]